MPLLGSNDYFAPASHIFEATFRAQEHHSSPGEGRAPLSTSFLVLRRMSVRLEWKLKVQITSCLHVLSLSFKCLCLLSGLLPATLSVITHNKMGRGKKKKKNYGGSDFPSPHHLAHFFPAQNSLCHLAERELEDGGRRGERELGPR